jgi:circadian clock protein KaiC
MDANYNPARLQDLVATGINGLNHLLRGGLTRDRMYLIEGDPGTGKTTLAMQFLLEGRSQGEVGLYVTLSETEQELRAVAASHGWSLDGLELFQLSAMEGSRQQDQYTLYHPAEVELGETMQRVTQVIEHLKPTRIVLDSLSEMRLLAREPLRYRRQILSLKEFFSGRSCTVLLLDDHANEPDQQLQSLSHGVIQLDQLPFEYGRARRRIRILKMRGLAAVEGFHDFKIQRGGLVVFPQLTPASDRQLRKPEPDVKSGVAELDLLLGGGIAWGSTTLLIGPAGSGKSTVAAHYAASMDLPNKAAVFLFEERPDTFLLRCDALGMQLSARVKSGAIELVQVNPGDLSPGEFLHLVRESVEVRGARLVMIDSLNGYLNAIPQSDAPLVRMHELLAYLNGRGIASLVIVAQHGIVGTGMMTPIDVSYLADTVILLRFFEAAGQVRKAISVVKKRSGTHETTIRELRIGPGSLRVGAALTEFQGVLTGVPQYIGTAAPLLKNE